MEWSDRGQDNLTHAKRLHTTAIDFYRRNDLQKATLNLTEALRLRVVALPQSHPQIVATEEFLINLYHQQGLHILELQHLRHLLQLKKLRFGHFHVETELTTTQLSDLLASMGEKVESDELAGEVWRMRAMPTAQRQALDFEEVLTNLATTNVRRADSKKLIDHFFGAAAEPKMRASPFADDATWFKNLTERLQMQKENEAMFKQNERDAAKAIASAAAAAAAAGDATEGGAPSSSPPGDVGSGVTQPLTSQEGAEGHSSLGATGGGMSTDGHTAAASTEQVPGEGEHPTEVQGTK